ncbi:hypothetical protein [Brevundimonas sp.]|uniref:hypothetical protein n=1 Tax=Brevundimonas sp. TaxID=1871086 RepID=UPI0025D81A8F|nr:hypothetical protein [Brevundimonas sp.]
MFILAFAAVVAVQDAPQPDPQTWYWQAGGCAASAAIESEHAGTALSEAERSALTAEMIGGGMVMAQMGPDIGRTPEQIDSQDGEAMMSFFDMMREHRREAFDAHRAYCRALLARRP